MWHSLRQTTAFLLLSSPVLAAELFERGKQLMVCHRMANRDVPENTIESLREAHQLGCDITEIDIWRMADGELMLLHDGPIDRVSTGSGVMEAMLSSELALYDAGSWFNSRFTGARHPRFVEALRFAKDSGIRLQLDHKSKGITREVYEVVKAEGMLDRVAIGGSEEELAKLGPHLLRQPTAAWQPDMTREQVAALQRQGKFVVSSFSANDHEMDFVMMRRAVAAGVDVLNTDHPRLGAEALGRGIEKRALALISRAQSGDVQTRVRAIAQLGAFRDLPLNNALAKFVTGNEPLVSRAAAVAFVNRRDPECVPALIATVADNVPRHSVANVAWIAGMLAVPPPGTATWLVRNAESADSNIAVESLRALSRIELATVPKELLLRRLNDSSGMVRGAAARALARHVPSSASALIVAAAKLQREMHEHWSTYAGPPAVNAFGKHRTTFERPAPTNPRAIEQIAKAHDLYRGYHNVIQSLASMQSAEAKNWLHEQVLRNESDFSGYASYVAAFQLWDRADPAKLAPALAMDDPMRRDRVEWTLIKHGPSNAAPLRELLSSKDENAQLRAAQALAWLGDGASRPTIENLARTAGPNRDMYEWCLQKMTEVERVAGGGR